MRIFDTVVGKARRAFGYALAVPLFRGCEQAGRTCAIGYVRVNNGGRMVLGERVTFYGGMLPTELICHPGALLEIGSDCAFNYGVSIEATGAVHIGDRCLFASMVRIADAGPRAQHRKVVIGDDVWVAHGAILTPGVTVGAGSVVSAGAVVASDIPPGMLAIGNPARCIRLDMAGRSRDS
ncbi:MAG: acyltransferase [Myxococcaceae bacterium]